MSLLTVLLLGKTGCGKSTLGNCLLGLRRNDEMNYHFEVGGTEGPVTKCTVEPQACTKVVQACHLRVIDTPGFFDTELEAQNGCIDLLKSVSLAGNRLDAFIIVVKALEMKPGLNILFTMKKILGDLAYKKVIIVFTHLDDTSLNDEHHLKTFNNQLGYQWKDIPPVFMHHRSRPARHESRSKIISLLKEIQMDSEIEITRCNFKSFTRKVFEDAVKNMYRTGTFLYEDVRKKLYWCIELAEHFCSKEDVKSILHALNEKDCQIKAKGV